MAGTHDGNVIPRARAAIGARIPQKRVSIRRLDVIQSRNGRPELVLAFVDVEAEIVRVHPLACRQVRAGPTDLLAVLVNSLPGADAAQRDLVTGRDRLGRHDFDPFVLYLGAGRQLDARHGDVVARVKPNPRIGRDSSRGEVDELRRHDEFLQIRCQRVARMLKPRSLFRGELALAIHRDAQHSYQ